MIPCVQLFGIFVGMVCFVMLVQWLENPMRQIKRFIHFLLKGIYMVLDDLRAAVDNAKAAIAKAIDKINGFPAEKEKAISDALAGVQEQVDALNAVAKDLDDAVSK